MKSSFAQAVISILVVGLILTGAQGIRFKKGLLSPVGQHHHEIIHNERIVSLIKTSDDGSSSVREVVYCKDCSIGSMNRKFISTTTTTTTSSSSTTTSKNDANHTSTLGKQAGYFTTNSPPTSDNDHEQNKSSDDHDQYDLTDIAEMDYSPARRKPPIHN